VEAEQKQCKNVLNSLATVLNKNKRNAAGGSVKVVHPWHSRTEHHHYFTDTLHNHRMLFAGTFICLPLCKASVCRWTNAVFTGALFQRLFLSSIVCEFHQTPALW